jgi:radical SAM protein with 4Fe4S-binding SPASM domain
LNLKNKQLIVETTNLCDARCITCPREQFKQKPLMMDMGLFKKIVDDAVQYGIESVDTCGFGEPLLDKYLFERYAYIREKLPKAQIFCSTTGFHLDAEKWLKVVQYVDIIKLSIYGVTKETYEAFHRGRLKYEESMSNILGFLAFKGNAAPRTVGLFLSTELNGQEQEAWLRRWEPMLDEVMIWQPHNWVNGRHYRDLDYSRQRSCGRPENAPLYIHADGTVSPCCFDIHKGIPLGDMNTQTIEEVYRGEPYRRLREAHRECNFDDYICKGCDQTNHNPGVLLYHSNPDREVGQLISNVQKIYKEEVPVFDYKQHEWKVSDR